MTPMSENRFQDLMGSLQAAYQEAEPSFEERKAQAIKEIIELMKHHSIDCNQLQ